MLIVGTATDQRNRGEKGLKNKALPFISKCEHLSNSEPQPHLSSRIGGSGLAGRNV